MLFFVRSGRAYLSSGALKYLGNTFNYWSNTSSDASIIANATSYYFNGASSGLNPSNGPYSRWYGLPVRCLVY